MTQDTDRAGDVTAAPRVDVSNVVGVLRRGYGMAGRHLFALLVPVVVVLVPVSVVLGGLIVGVVGRGGLIVDGELTPVAVSPVLVAAVVVALVVWLAAYAVVLGAVVVMSGGLLLGRPVRPGAALRTAARRPGTLAVLGVLAVLLGVLSLAAGTAVAVVTEALWPAVVTSALVPAAGLWFVLGLPIALLDGRGAWRSLGRAWSSSGQRRIRDTIVLLLGVLAGPALVIAGVRWAVPPLGGTAHLVLGNALTGAVGLLAVPFQAMTLTAAALNLRYPRTPWDRQKLRPVDSGPIAARLADFGADARPRTRWAVPIVAVLALPGLLYGGYVRLNPLGLPADHVMGNESGRFSVALHLLPGDRPMAIDDTAYLTVRICDGPGCGAGHTYEYAGVDNGPLFSWERNGAATLPDGTVAVTAWSDVLSGTGRHRAVLRLLSCGAGGCGSRRTIGNAPIVDRAADYKPEATSAMTTTRDGILIAVARPGSKSTYRPQLRLIRCADARCAAPRTVMVAHLPDVVPGVNARPLAVAADRDGRPIVAYEDGGHGGVAVISCDSADCRHPRTTWPVPRPPAHVPEHLGDRYLDGVGIEVPPDGLPVLTYEDVRTGVARLLHCRTRDCAMADNTALTGPDSWRSRPALTLDRDGRPLVATYDRGGVELIGCQDYGCVRRRSTRLAKLKNGPGYLDLALAHDRRPVVLWSDEQPVLDSVFADGLLHLTSCARPRCGLP